MAAVVLIASMLLGCSSGSRANDAESNSGADGSMVGVDDVAAPPAGESTFDSPFYILVVGSDTRDGGVDEGKGSHGSDGHCRSDTSFFIRVDPANYSIALITIPRDTEISYDGRSYKLNHAYDVGGVEELSRQVEALTGVEAKYWFVMKLADFVPFIDGLGGVDVDVPVALNRRLYVTGQKIAIDAGYQHLDGVETALLVQNRMQYGGYADAARQIQSRKVVEWCIRHVAAMDADAAEQCANLLLSYCTTNMPAEECVNLVRAFAGHADQLSVVSCTGPYEGDIDAETELWLAYRDEETWRALIAAVEEGEDPTVIVPLPEVYAG